MLESTYGKSHKPIVHARSTVSAAIYERTINRSTVRSLSAPSFLGVSINMMMAPGFRSLAEPAASRPRRIIVFSVMRYLVRTPARSRTVSVFDFAS